MIGTIVRIIIGLVAACLAAGFTTVSFIIPPAGLIGASDETVQGFVTLSLLSATHTAVFGGAFALVAAIAGEMMRQRSWGFYTFAGVAIALAGFVALSNSQGEGEPSIVNNFALTAYLATGFVGGLVYWIVSGRSAGASEVSSAGLPSGRAASSAS